MRDLRTFALLLLFAIAAPGQTLVNVRTASGGGSAIYRPPILTGPPVTGGPVSYELHETRVQTLPDGTHITGTLRLERFWRDSQGRTRLERSVRAGNAQTPNWPTAEVADPVSGFWYLLETEKKIAHRSRLPKPDLGPSISFEPAVSNNETKVINGVVARGGRRTTTIPKNTQGNDRDLVITTEIWTSIELQITMFMETHDPRVGDTTMELENFSRAEPEAGLFTVPSDYRIVDESAQFTVTWGTPPPALAPPPPPPVPLSQGISGYRIGGGVSAPVPIYQPAPQYAEEARQAGIQGAVLLSIVVDENGQAQAIRVTRSLDPGLDQKAIEAVSQWRFRPGQKDGKPVPVMASVEVNFRLPQ